MGAGEKFATIDNDPAYWSAVAGGEGQAMNFLYQDRVEDTMSLDDLVGSIDGILDRIAPLVDCEQL